MLLLTLLSVDTLERDFRSAVESLISVDESRVRLADPSLGLVAAMMKNSNFSPRDLLQTFSRLAESFEVKKELCLPSMGLMDGILDNIKIKRNQIDEDEQERRFHREDCTFLGFITKLALSPEVPVR